MSFVRLFLMLLAFLTCCRDCLVVAQPVIAIVPQPKSLTLLADTTGFLLPEELHFEISGHIAGEAEHMKVVADALFAISGCRLKWQPKLKSGGMKIVCDDQLAPEAYECHVSENQIELRAATLQGLSHATASLLQILSQVHGNTVAACSIRDQPSCSYRSLMIDLGRNPHSLESLRETVDLAWMYKLDSVHLHLTDDQYFAFPSKAFPKLPTVRNAISWDEFAELEQYASTRGVAIIPELEVPGHSSLLTRTYPKVFGEDSHDVATKPSSIEAIKTLLDEMMQLFPSSPYVHVGGDEASGVSEESQRALVNTLHAYLKAQGKKTVVWEGPRLGAGSNKIHEDVIHINWRTINFPADKMIAAGYPVVNAAWDPLYVVDHYPRNNFTMASPQHIYEKLDLFRFGHFNPGISTFAEPIQVPKTDQVIGFCMPWWEGREANYIPLVFPRAIPMAEIAWNPSAQPRDYQAFARRTAISEDTRRRAFYPVSIDASALFLENEGVFHNETTVRLSKRVDGELRYTLDGKAPTVESPKYNNPIELSESCIVRAAVFVGSQQIGHGSRKTLVHVVPVANLALGKPVVSSATAGPLHSVARLTDGGTGLLDYYLGYPAEPDPISLTVDLQKLQPVNQVVVHSFGTETAYESYTVHISADGKTFTQVADRTKPSQDNNRVGRHDFASRNIRYVRIETHGCKRFVFDSFSKITEIQVFAPAE